MSDDAAPLDGGEVRPLDVEENLARILASPTYRLAESDPLFLKSRVMRPLRLAMELLKPEEQQKAQGIKSTVVLFGGTRIRRETEARARLEEAEAALARAPQDASARQAVRIARSLLEKARYWEEARRLAKMITTSCQTEELCDFVIVTGGGPGIMEAGNRGAYEVDGKSMGLNITIPEEQEPNPYVTPELCFQFHYFAMRKMHFLMRAKAMVAFPGGFGTCDEVFETLTLIQTKVMQRIPIILLGRRFWRRVIDWDGFVEEGVVSPEDLDLFEWADTAEEAWDAICRFHGLSGVKQRP